MVRPKKFTILLIVTILLTPTSVLAKEKDESAQDPKAAETASVSGTAEEAKKKLDENQKIINGQQKKLKDLEQQIAELSSKKDNAGAQAQIAANQLDIIETELKQAELQLEQTLLSVTATQDGIEQVTQELDFLSSDIEQGRRQMSEILRSLYEHGNVSVLDIFLGRQTLSEYIREKSVYQELQKRALALTKGLQERQEQQVKRQQELEEQQVGLQQLKEAQGYQQAELTEKKQIKEGTVSQKQAEQAQYSNQLKDAKQARVEIEQKIFSLQGIGVQFALSDAFEAAKFASSVTGIRPALLLAMVKVETNVGKNIGSGVYPDDMHQQSREAFLRVTSKLNLDPQTAPISRRPQSYKGWGGALGPGQFMPASWETIEARDHSKALCCAIAPGAGGG